MPSACGQTLRVAAASVLASPCRVSSRTADTKRRVAAARRLTKKGVVGNLSFCAFYLFVSFRDGEAVSCPVVRRDPKGVMGRQISRRQEIEM